ncbi:unnamed protein product [Gongylonema pulchrum]|uniref:Pentatricopeptide repeat-containing protein n=1 Tax=Gongylonema pulchrum TaxID=637853 RepID=A0A183EAP0_9BILA|nr:unnamed protein product [Gongylonema pulchrum]
MNSQIYHQKTLPRSNKWRQLARKKLSFLIASEISSVKQSTVVLDTLKSIQPCFDGVGLASAIAYANSCAKIPLCQIASALAAANALEMWDMCAAIVEELRLLATQPKNAPFVIELAVRSLEQGAAKQVIKELGNLQQTLPYFDEVIEQPNFPSMSLACLEKYIALFLDEVQYFCFTIFKIQPCASSKVPK